MANELRADAIMVFTIRGYMALYTAWMRPRLSPIYAICETRTVADSLSLCWGISPFVIPFDHAVPEKTIDNAIQILLAQGRLKKGNTVVVISAISGVEALFDAVQMRVLS